MNARNGNENERKTKKGIEVKKKTKIVEEHYDDCGTNLLGLGDPETFFNEYKVPDNDEPFVKGLVR